MSEQTPSTIPTRETIDGTTYEWVSGRDLVEGDIVIIMDRTDRITRLEPYEGSLLEYLGTETRIAQLAVNPVGSMTIEPDMPFLRAAYE